MRRWFFIPCLLLALLLIIPGALLVWSGGHGTSDEGGAADFRFINRGEIGTLDPNRMSWLQDIRIGYALWEGLYSLDPQTLEPILGTADRVAVSPDKTLYTFHIRATARWSNGDAVTSADFVFAWRRMLEEPGDYTYLLHCIHGADAYETGFAAGKKPDFGTVGIVAPDDRTLCVKLDHPVTFFPDLCAFPPFFPLHEKSMKEFERIDPATGRRSFNGGFTRAGKLVGNGPFRLADWQFKRSLRLEASEYYWDRANVRSKSIVMVSSDDTLNSFLAYDGGAVDWWAEVVGEIGAEMRDAGRRDLHVFPGFGSYFYSINCQPQLPNGRANPFVDIRVRQAFAMAVDREPIVRNISRLGEPPATHYIPPGIFPDFQMAPGLGFDVAAARKLLVDAGYPGGKGFPKFSILYNSEGQHGQVAQSVRKQWATHLGVQVDLEGVEIKTFRQRLHNKDYVIARASWIGDYNDPSTFTDKYLSNSENNDSGWKNADYDRLCAQAAVEPDPSKRLRLLEQAEAMIDREVPIIPLYHYVNAYAYRDNVKGIALHPRNMVMFKAVEVERPGVRQQLLQHGQAGTVENK